MQVYVCIVVPLDDVLSRTHEQTGGGILDDCWSQVKMWPYGHAMMSEVTH